MQVRRKGVERRAARPLNPSSTPCRGRFQGRLLMYQETKNYLCVWVFVYLPLGIRLRLFVYLCVCVFVLLCTEDFKVSWCTKKLKTKPPAVRSYLLVCEIQGGRLEEEEDSWSINTEKKWEKKPVGQIVSWVVNTFTNSNQFIKSWPRV